MSATLRDMGRMGILMLANGVVFGEQIVPSAFIEDIRATPDYAGKPSQNMQPESGSPYYRSFWWGLGNDGKDIRAIGQRGQYLHVAPEAGVVIAAFSSWPSVHGDGRTHGVTERDELVAALIAKLRQP